MQIGALLFQGSLNSTRGLLDALSRGGLDLMLQDTSPAKLIPSLCFQPREARVMGLSDCWTLPRGQSPPRDTGHIDTQTVPAVGGPYAGLQDPR